MGYEKMSSGRTFRIPYSDGGDCKKLTQQVDVLAVDAETVLVVECKASGAPSKKGFKEVVEAIGGKKAGMLKTIRSAFPESKHKVKFIFATENYVLNEQDLERLNHFDIAYFDEDEVEYYDELTTHLGPAAKYQLLGSLLEGQTIPEIENRVPAVRGKLGKHDFYSFAIEPERLLKLGFVLHRHKAHKERMPTYQRLLKKDRLKSIEEFISKGGYFPNTIIISLETDRPLQFDLAEGRCDGTVSRAGVLHLPQKYQSAFIIDGQHRVYGYANSDFKHTSTVPVVAFENLSRSEQVELFMTINENQKPVSKNLRNTLNAELLWDSPDRTEAMKALKLRIAQELGSNRGSPLFGRVMIGEKARDETACITIDTINEALNVSRFFGSVTRKSIKELGTFYDGDVERTSQRLLEYLMRCLDYVRENLPEQWEAGANSYLTINPTVYVLIRLLSDICDHIVSTEEAHPRSDAVGEIVSSVKPYLDPVIWYFRSLPRSETDRLRRSYGTGGRTSYWRTLEREIQKARSEFNPKDQNGKDLNEWVRDNSKQFNTKAFELIRDIETHLKKDVRERLIKEFGEKSWWKKGVPLKVYEQAVMLAATKNREIDDPANEVDPWDQLHLIDYRDIMLQNWGSLFQTDYALPGVSGDKKARTDWLEKLNRIRNQNFHEYSVTGDEYDFLTCIHEWLCD
jgi:DNA sulfur modification protein DndB